MVQSNPAPSATDENRFVAVQQNGIICVSGSVHDSTNLVSLEVLLGERRTISFKSIEYATWNGLRALINLLIAKNAEKIIDVPFQLFEELKLMDEVDSSIAVDSYFCEFADTTSSKWAPSYRQAVYGVVFLVDFDEDVRPTLPYRHLLGMNNPVRSQMLTESKEFSYDYLAFCSAVSGMLHRQLVAAGFGFESLFRRLKMRLTNLQGVSTLLGINIDGKVDTNDVRDCLAFLLKFTSTFADALGEFSNTNLKFLHEIERSAEHTVLKSMIQKSLLPLERLISAKPHLEEVGIKLGKVLQTADCTRQLQQAMSSYDPSKLGIETANAVKDALNVMDPLVGESWEEIRPLIQEELIAYQDDLLGGMVLLQGFDLARQVLEHREIELNLGVMQGFFSENSEVTIADQQKLLEQISKKLVTEQESCTFKYFFGKWASTVGIGERKQEAEPGDMMLF
jgi:hypothetical protein